jgi:hypothetical protein
MSNTITHYESPIGLTVYQFKDDSTVTITGNVSQKYTVKEFDGAYDFEEYIQKKIDCTGINFDSEYCQFFAYANTPDEGIAFAKSIENWFQHIRETVG